MKNIEIEGLDKAIGNFNLFIKKNHIASKQSLNQIGLKAKTKSLRDTNTEWKGIKAKDLKKTVTITQATNTDQSYTFSMYSKPIQLHLFSADYRGTTTETGKKRSSSKVGVAYTLKTSKRTLGNSFMRKSKFGKKENIVFTRRKSPNGANITAHSAITQTSMFAGVDGVETFIEMFRTEYPKRYLDKIYQMTHIKIT